MNCTLGTFTNYVDKILAFFNHLLPSVDIFVCLFLGLGLDVSHGAAHSFLCDNIRKKYINNGTDAWRQYISAKNALFKSSFCKWSSYMCFCYEILINIYKDLVFLKVSLPRIRSYCSLLYFFFHELGVTVNRFFIGTFIPRVFGKKYQKYMYVLPKRPLYFELFINWTIWI